MSGVDYTVAIAGNPNSGKTTLFNTLTGTHQHVGNWPGVTVELKEGALDLNPVENFLAAPFTAGTEEDRATPTAAVMPSPKPTRVRLIDLPGIYSLAASTEDERVARDYLLSGDADLVIDVVDATNLQRNLYLTSQLIEMGVPVLLVLNMIDRAEKQGQKIEMEHLSKHLGVPVIPASALCLGSVQKVRHAIESALANPPHSTEKVHYPKKLEQVVSSWEPRLSRVSSEIGASPRWVAVKLLEGEPWVRRGVFAAGAMTEEYLLETREALERELDDELDIVIADARYGFIHGVTRDVVTERLSKESVTDRIDRIVMNRWLGIPTFFAVMYAVFWVTINVGGSFIDFFDALFGALLVDGLGSALRAVAAPEWLVTILADGIGTGIQTVATFIPIIFTMFLMLSLLENSGYMARAAFVMDRFMRLIGLPGKSFVPMMVGFGCTVPAIAGTRTLQSKKDRYMTIFMAPFMSCGARLPVYALFAAAFFPDQAGFVVFSLYLIGIVLAILTGVLLKQTLFRGETSHFVMELPPYHAPHLRNLWTHTWNRLKLFIWRAGTTITIAVALLSLLDTIGTDGSIGNSGTERSLLASLGKGATPIFEPLGVEEENWEATVGLFTGIFAKEAIVGTLNSLYASEAAGAPDAGEEEQFNLLPAIGGALATIPDAFGGILDTLLDPLGISLISEEESALAAEIAVGEGIFPRLRENFSRPGAYAYLLFVLIYFPCMASLGTAIKEMNTFFGLLLALYTTLLAWIVATGYFQMFGGSGIPGLLVPGVMLAALIAGLALVGRVSRQQLTEVEYE
ncbi:MAG: ferrous iron transport protein B [Spirochaetaceae bacterium]